MIHKKLTAATGLLGLLLFTVPVKPQPAWDLTKDFAGYVNPFIGTGGHGHTFPGASVPFGMVQLSPDTRLTGWDGCSAYHYSDSLVYGFSHTHLSGTGCSDYADILLMPTTGDVSPSNTAWRSPFRHSEEKASPGWYRVFLDKYGIDVELTAAMRTGLHKYVFPANNKSNIIIDLQHRDKVLESSLEFINNMEIRGLRRSQAWADDQYVYFVVRFSRPFTSHGIFRNEVLQPGKDTAGGTDLKAFVTFETADNDVILAKVGISAVSIEGALKNMETEIPGWNFDFVHKQAVDLWNRELGRIEAESRDREGLAIFYTALYHSMLVPNLYSDVDGSYRGRDLKVHQAGDFDYYTVFSLWDTYRAEHPLFSIIDQKRTSDFLNTFIRQYEEGGRLPVWELSSNETFCMIGYHAVPVIADAMIKDIGRFDRERAYQACVYSAREDRSGLAFYKKQGFIPGDKESESVSKTLEYAYDDWCISRMASLLNKPADYLEFTARAQSYRNLFDPSTGFMRPRYNGGWYSPFDPSEVNNHYTEANSWQYSFYVPQDLNGLMALHGGNQKFAAKLDALFSASTKTTGREQADISGLIGQYAHGNEPSHHMSYLYDYAGQPWKTQYIVHRILTDFHSTKPDGLIGNEDCGQMSAWYVLSAMGFYPVCPGQQQYAIGTPRFEKVTLHLENGRTFTITAKDLTPENFYIQSATLNGKPYSKCHLDHSDLMNGGTLEFAMGAMPNKSWGSGADDLPVTAIAERPATPVPLIGAPSRTFKESMKVAITCPDKDASIYYTLDGTVPGPDKLLYDKPVVLENSTTIKAMAVSPVTGAGFPTEGTFFRIIPGRSIALHTRYENQYTGGGNDALIDGIRGSTDWRMGDWQGYENTDLDCVIDLGKTEEIHRISAGFLQDAGAWIWFPKWVEIAVSEDNVHFTTVEKIQNPVSDQVMDVTVRDFSVKVNLKARYVKVFAKCYGTIPGWHVGHGSPSHLFADEITVE